MKKTILILAALLPCIPATLHSGPAQPVIPAGYGTYYAPVYSVTDSAGVRHSGVVYGDDKYSITYPLGGGTRIMRCGNLIIPLDYKLRR
jgi:hypothetical protein